MPGIPLPLRDDVTERGARAASTRQGLGVLEFTRVGARTVLTRAFATSPLKFLNPRRADQSASVYLATYGGGLVGGDRIDVSIGVGPGAAALVTTQASTKVFRSPLGARQDLRAQVAGDGLLALLPDPVTCFAGASYRQEQHIHLDATASLVLVDRLTAGRIESGERWRFDEYANRLFIWQGDRLVLHDAVVLTGEDGDVAARFGRVNCLAVVVLAGPALAATAARLTETIDSTPLTRRPDLLASAAPFGDAGAIFRFASHSVEDLALALRRDLGIVATLLGDDPWIGK
jgi:urease accessory protein